MHYLKKNTKYAKIYVKSFRIKTYSDRETRLYQIKH